MSVATAYCVHPQALKGGLSYRLVTGNHELDDYNYCVIERKYGACKKRGRNFQPLILTGHGEVRRPALGALLQYGPSRAMRAVAWLRRSWGGR